jgi:hypothetical protein
MPTTTATREMKSFIVMRECRVSARKAPAAAVSPDVAGPLKTPSEESYNNAIAGPLATGHVFAGAPAARTDALAERAGGDFPLTNKEPRF